MLHLYWLRGADGLRRFIKLHCSPFKERTNAHMECGHDIVTEFCFASRLLTRSDTVQEIAPVFLKGSAASAGDFLSWGVTNDFSLRVNDRTRTFKDQRGQYPVRNRTGRSNVPSACQQPEPERAFQFHQP